MKQGTFESIFGIITTLFNYILGAILIYYRLYTLSLICIILATACGIVWYIRQKGGKQ